MCKSPLILQTILSDLDDYAAKTQTAIGDNFAKLEKATAQFDLFFHSLSTEASSKPDRIMVQRLLAGKFFNHIISSFVLMQRGLIADATSSKRAALETLALFKTISIDDHILAQYISKQQIKPGKVRYTLKKQGYPKLSELIENTYTLDCNITHPNIGLETFFTKKNGKKLIDHHYTCKTPPQKYIESIARSLPNLLTLFTYPLDLCEKACSYHTLANETTNINKETNHETDCA